MKSVELHVLSSNLPSVIDDHIYHLPAEFIFISILMMTKGTRKQTTEPILGRPILGTAILRTNQLQPVEWEGVAYCSSVGISGNIPRFVYVDLIRKTIQVILE